MKKGIILSMVLTLFMSLPIGSVFASENHNDITKHKKSVCDEWFARCEKYLNDEDKAWLNRDDETFYKEILKDIGLAEEDVDEEMRNEWKTSIINTYKIEYMCRKECAKYINDKYKAWLDQDDEIFYKKVLNAEHLTEEYMNENFTKVNLAFWKKEMIKSYKVQNMQLAKQLAEHQANAGAVIEDENGHHVIDIEDLPNYTWDTEKDKKRQEELAKKQREKKIKELAEKIKKTRKSLKAYTQKKGFSKKYKMYKKYKKYKKYRRYRKYRKSKAYKMCRAYEICKKKYNKHIRAYKKYIANLK